MSDISGGSGDFGTAFGVGIWIALLASIGVLASAWLLKSPGDSIKDGFDSLKTKISSNLNTTGTGAGSGASKVDELERLIKLRDEGKITEEDYQKMKAKIM